MMGTYLSLAIDGNKYPTKNIEHTYSLKPRKSRRIRAGAHGSQALQRDAGSINVCRC